MLTVSWRGPSFLLNRLQTATHQTLTALPAITQPWIDRNMSETVTTNHRGEITVSEREIWWCEGEEVNQYLPAFSACLPHGLPASHHQVLCNSLSLCRFTSPTCLLLCLFHWHVLSPLPQGSRNKWQASVACSLFFVPSHPSVCPKLSLYLGYNWYSYDSLYEFYKMLSYMNVFFILCAYDRTVF